MDADYVSILIWLISPLTSLLKSVPSLLEQGGGQGPDQGVTTQLNSAQLGQLHVLGS